jgi:hypothetical protein
MSSKITRLLGVFPSLPSPTGRECAVEQRVGVLGVSGWLVRCVKLRLRTDEEFVLDLLGNEPDALTVLFERLA